MTAIALIANTVANAVMAVVTTSSPGPMPIARRPISIASMPLPTEKRQLGEAQGFTDAFGELTLSGFSRQDYMAAELAARKSATNSK